MNILSVQKGSERGFTIIELAISIAIVGIIGTSVVTLISLLYNTNGSTSDTVTVQNQVGNAASWITVDAQMAQRIVTDDPLHPGSLVTLDWVWWDDNNNIEYEVTYSINSNNELERACTKTDHSNDNVEEGLIVVAQYLDSAATNCQYNPSSHLITFNVTASITRYRTVSATSIVKVIPRTSL